MFGCNSLLITLKAISVWESLKYRCPLQSKTKVAVLESTENPSNLSLLLRQRNVKILRMSCFCVNLTFIFIPLLLINMFFLWNWSRDIWINSSIKNSLQGAWFVLLCQWYNWCFLVSSLSTKRSRIGPHDAEVPRIMYNPIACVECS